MHAGNVFMGLIIASLTLASARAQQYDWIQRFSSESSGHAIAVDDAQNVYVAGTFKGTNFLGTNEFSVAVTNGSFLVKLNAEGDTTWTMALEGSISRIAVNPGGTLYVVGRFTVPANLLNQSAAHSDVADVVVARIDQGRFTWFHTAESTSGDSLRALALAPDGNIWTVGGANPVLLRKYSESGVLLRHFDLGTNSFSPNALAVNRDERLFVSGFTGANTPWFGTNQISRSLYFVAALDPDETPLWAWTPGDNYSPASGYNSINAIACTPEGNVVSIGTRADGFARGAVLVTHSPAGEKLGQTARWGNWPGGHKSIHTGQNLFIDTHGNIYACGTSVSSYMYPSPKDGLWFATFSNGVRIAEATVSNRRFSNPWNTANAIAATPDGAIYITGQLTGAAIFGTNQVFGGGGAFVARRSTLNPELAIQRVGDSVVLSWPRAAFPFALQESDDTGTNWTFVSQPPQRDSTRWQVTLPASEALGTFRLLQTNEAPVRHPVSVRWIDPPTGTPFLNHPAAILLPKTTNALGTTLSAYVSAGGPGNRVTFETFNAATGEHLTTPRSFPVDAYIPLYSWYIVCYCTGVNGAPVSFPPGQHEVLFRVSDGVDSFTNLVAFEVMEFETALAELRSALGTLEFTRAGRHAIAIFEGLVRAKETDREKLAGKRWQRFQHQLERVPSLTENERAVLIGATGRLTILL